MYTFLGKDQFDVSTGYAGNPLVQAIQKSRSDEQMRLDEVLLKELIQWFLSYVSGFSSQEPEKNKMFKTKIEHTMVVCREIGQLGQEMHLDQDGIILARIMGLFHDVGRFEQVRRFGTFMDRSSLDHGKLGEQILRENQVLDQLDHEQQELVFKAVRYHNRKELPPVEDEAFIFFTSLLRDADKLDIYRVVRDRLAGDEQSGTGAPSRAKPCHGSCSQKVLQSLEEGRIVDSEEIKSDTDYALLLISWVYDIHYAQTARRLQTRGYITRLQQSLPRIPQMNEAVSNALEFLRTLAAKENGSHVRGLVSFFREQSNGIHG